MRLIDIEPFETEKDVIRCQITRWHNGDGYADMVVTNTEDIPAADVAPVVHGEWEKEFCSNGWHEWDNLICKNCGKKFERVAWPSEWHFCPNCGADMRERKGDGNVGV